MYVGLSSGFRIAQRPKYLFEQVAGTPLSFLPVACALSNERRQWLDERNTDSQKWDVRRMSNEVFTSGDRNVVGFSPLMEPEFTDHQAIYYLFLLYLWIFTFRWVNIARVLGTKKKNSAWVTIRKLLFVRDEMVYAVVTNEEPEV